MSRERLLQLFLQLPRPVAARAYGLARATVFRDTRRPLFERAFDACRDAGAPGDYLEFGVYRGTSFVTAWKAARARRLDGMRFFAFDSFQGLPEGEGDGRFRQGDFVSDAELFRRVVDRAGVDLERVRVVEGLYDETLTAETKRRHDLRRAAVVHVDCDLYSSAVRVLDFVEDLVVPGTVLLFDDWHSFGARSEEMGEARAFKEWRLHERFEMLYDAPDLECRAFVMTDGSPG